ncbi:MAG: NHLP family bacteriocin export ABC transporter peptidase/permease/ATPase subunit [Alphaproteobacteria bacterium]|nr:NHLP family bacteriocin export ABC transporter peptidase/permease/ATPase subunit [Alphaproteobacteria bacterium]
MTAPAVTATTATAQEPTRVKAPSILQFEAVECGAASLAMILAHYGAWIPLEQLREACGVSRDGSKASNVLTAGRKYGLVSKGFKKEVDRLRDLRWPLIVHWNFNHFVVFEGFEGGRAWINDPAQGRRGVTMQEFDEAFTGVALAFEPGPEFKTTAKPPGLVAALKPRFGASREAFALLFLVSIALVIPGLVVPAFAKIFVDGILINHQDRWIMPLLIGMVLTAIVRMLLTLLQQRIMLKLETKLAVVGAAVFIWHVIRLPMTFFTQRHSGEIASRVQSNESVAKLLSGDFSSTAIQLCEVVFFALIMLTYDPILGGAAILLSVPNFFLLRYMRERMTDTQAQMEAAQGRLGAATVGTIQNIETLKASGLEKQSFERWAGHHANTLDSMRAAGAQSVILGTVPALLSGFTSMAILSLGAWRVMTGSLTIGDLVAFQSLAGSFSGPIAGFVGLGTTVTNMKVTLQRVDDALKNPVDPLVGLENEGTSPEAYAPLRGDIELSDVSFGYSRLEPPLMEGVNLKLKPGMRVAFVGGSGSGKSTLGRLICGLFEPWSGEIRFDGKALRSIPQANRARSIAYVDQDIFLFEGTVSDNLTLWNRSVPEEDMTRALADAAILDDIAVRPGQLEAHVEEGGRNFSGGQRQRLEIARALVGNPSILVLDEATAALDTSTEKLIDDNMRRRGCTCIIIAHRLSTIRDCDEIIVLSRGKVVERGTHEALMALEGEYTNLIRSI